MYLFIPIHLISIALKLLSVKHVHLVQSRDRQSTHEKHEDISVLRLNLSLTADPGYIVKYCDTNKHALQRVTKL